MSAGQAEPRGRARRELAESPYVGAGDDRDDRVAAGRAGIRHQDDRLARRRQLDRAGRDPGARSIAGDGQAAELDIAPRADLQAEAAAIALDADRPHDEI